MFLLNDMRYAVERFGEARPPQGFIFLVFFGGFAAKEHQEKKFSWRAAGPPNLLPSKRPRK
jgi:hypothetical protein